MHRRLLVSALLSLTASVLVSIVLAQTEGSIRLNNDGDQSRLYFGRLEIFVRGVWGTVCDDGFDLTDATVACRELGYSGVLLYGNVGRLRFSAGSGRIWVENLRCRSTSQTIAQCPRRSYGVHDCSHGEDVALVCVGEGSMRLVPRSGRGSFSASTSSGRLEIYAGGQWGTVCSDGFGSTEARIGCQQLGFTRAIREGTTAFSFNNLPILLDNLHCSSSSDDYLLECSHRGIGVHNCGHSEDVDLSCSRLTSTTVPRRPMSNSITTGFGVSVSIVVLIIIVISIVCCCCCYGMKRSSSRSRQVIVQPQATTAYPMQVTIQTAYSAQAAPLQQYPQAAAPYPQPAPQQYAQQPAPQYAQQPYPTGGYPAGPYPPQQQPAPYPIEGQVPPAPYPTGGQVPPPPYPPPQQQPSPYPTEGQVPPASYPTEGQAPPAPYPSDIAPPSAYPPGPSDLSTYKDPPPAYGDIPSASPPPQ